MGFERHDLFHSMVLVTFSDACCSLYFNVAGRRHASRLCLFARNNETIHHVKVKVDDAMRQRLLLDFLLISVKE